VASILIEPPSNNGTPLITAIFLAGDIGPVTAGGLEPLTFTFILDELSDEDIAWLATEACPIPFNIKGFPIGVGEIG
jgi:hypothetical protein